MKKDIDEFIEEISSNFSDLFVETFFIRFLSNYDRKNLFNAFKDTKELMNNKINKKFILKMEKYK